jgi:hypothetical protein
MGLHRSHTQDLDLFFTEVSRVGIQLGGMCFYFSSLVSKSLVGHTDLLGF